MYFMLQSHFIVSDLFCYSVRMYIFSHDDGCQVLQDSFKMHVSTLSLLERVQCVAPCISLLISNIVGILTRQALPRGLGNSARLQVLFVCRHDLHSERFSSTLTGSEARDVFKQPSLRARLNKCCFLFC